MGSVQARQALYHRPTSSLPFYFLCSELGFPGYRAHSALQVIFESVCDDIRVPLCLKLDNVLKFFLS